MSRAPEDPGQPLPPDGFARLLELAAPAFGATLDPLVLTALSRYLAELDRWRRRTNLTGALTAEELAEHTLESILGESLIVHGERVVDIGSGAGFPGVPLSIRRPDLAVTLVEPRGKKAAFLRHVARDLGLSNVTVSESRIEEVGGQTFAFATTRAVGNFSRWVGEARFLEPNGLLLAWTTEPEKVGLELPGFELERRALVPGTGKRQIAAFRKRS